MAYHTTGENKYVFKYCEIVNDWLDNNSYLMGVNWTSGIELSIRIVNLIWGLFFLEGFEFAKNDLKRIDTFIWLHAWHLYRYPSKYSSNNNHAIAEAFALYLSGIFFPHLKDAQRWVKFGKQV